ncbi:MAG: hypothetical protein Q7J79_09445 [Gemmatimonadales bacterium]|nr:hypothetical protein [Gemmatimonadales bacterium]
MLNTAEPRRPKRSPRSLRSEYEEFIDQRIEEYKDALPRAEILGIGDEAVQELSRSQQFQLTEVVLTEQVDAIIRRRLKLPTFRRWREGHIARRTAQTEPSHWGLAPHEPVVALGEAIEDQDSILVIGASDGACALFLAAKGAEVTVVDPGLIAIGGLENRAIVEDLGGRIMCRVEDLARFTPEGCPFIACVIETIAIADLSVPDRADLIQRLKTATPDEGRHVVMPGSPMRGGGVSSLSSDALRSLYSDWSVLRPPLGSGTASGRRPRNVGFIAIRTESRQSETPMAVSK